MRLVRRYVRAVDGLSHAIGRAVAWLMPLMVLALAYEVFARYALSAPTIWAFDTGLYLYAFIGMLGGAAALRHDAHIKVDVLTGRLSDRTRAWFDLLTAPLIVFFLVLVVDYVWASAADMYARGARRPTEFAPPLWLLVGAVPVGAVLLLMQLSANLARSFHLAFSGQPLFPPTPADDDHS